MEISRLWMAALSLLLANAVLAQDPQIDSTPHRVQVVPVEAGIKLEVIDWGGSGHALVLLAGLGDTAHVFDKFALRLTPNYHVYGITRRGFGASTAPSPQDASYSANRLGDDILAVVDALKLDRPILAGHSVAGEELSSIGTRHPEKVSALIYIDAGYAYALYDEAHGDLVLDSIALRNKLDQLHLGTLHLQPEHLTEILLGIRQLQGELQQRQEDISGSVPHPVSDPASNAVLDGQQKYTRLDIPTLAIFNVPHSPAFQRTMERQAHAFEAQVSRARIVRIANSDHYVFRTSEDQVVREINDFLASLHLRSSER